MKKHDDKHDAYQPIDCTVHDRIEAHATEGHVVRIVYRQGEEVREISDRIVDWFVRDGAEYMRTSQAVVVRLDRIVSIDDVAGSREWDVALPEARGDAADDQT